MEQDRGEETVYVIMRAICKLGIGRRVAWSPAVSCKQAFPLGGMGRCSESRSGDSYFFGIKVTESAEAAAFTCTFGGTVYMEG
jgi:hypothetical protein